MFNVLEEIFEEYHELFDYDSFHIGGDEVGIILLYWATASRSYISLTTYVCICKTAPNNMSNNYIILITLTLITILSNIG